MPITALPTPPTRSDPTTFAERGDAFMVALPTFATEANALATAVNADASTASTAASTATTQAGNASTSASNASNSAATATTQAGIATTQAGIATTKAGEANASAVAAAASAAVINLTAPGPIGGATPAAGSFTTLSATGTATTTFSTNMSAGQTFGPAGAGGGVFINTPSLSATYNSGLAIDGSYAGGATPSTINLKALGVYSGGGYASNLAFWTSSGTTASEKMRLDASGNLGLGVTPSAWGSGFRALEINRFSIASTVTETEYLHNGFWNGTNWIYKATDFATRMRNVNGQFQFWTAPSGTAGNAITFTQAMTLTAANEWLLGTTSVSTSPTQGIVAYGGNSGSGLLCIGHSSGTASGNAYHTFSYNGSAIGSITQSGTTAVLYNTTSDARLKTNIAPAADSASLIDALQVRQFDWLSDGSHQRYGFVAQELYAVAPEAVSKPQDPDEMMAVDYSKLVPMLVKEIQSLRARVAQLEGI